MTGLEVADVNIHIASVDMENEKASKRKRKVNLSFFSMNVCVSWHFFAGISGVTDSRRKHEKKGTERTYF